MCYFESWYRHKFVCVCVGGGDAGLHAQLHVLTYYIHRNIDLNCTVILFKHTFEK